MRQRNNYTEIEDFLDDTSFQLWVRTNDDQQGWEEWTLENSLRAKLVEEARLWILAMKVPDNNLSQTAIETALESTWMKIDEKVANKNRIHRPIVKLWKNHWFQRIAAVFVFGLLSGFVYTSFFIPNKNVYVNYESIVDINGGLVEQINNSNKPQIITLSDGSSVLLQPNSKLSYPKIFEGNERKVYLSGEGFFEISKNPKKPFFVFANEIVTKVVGTSFRIKAYANESTIEVLVRTGVVKVKSNKLDLNLEKEEVALLPNQALRFTRQNQKFDKIVDITQDETLSRLTSNNIERLSFEFTDIPVTQILKTIEQAYSVDIDFPKEKLKDCHLTTSLSDQPLPEKLMIICKSIGNESNYIMNGNQIIITSNGCN